MASDKAIADSAKRPLVGASIAVWRDGAVLLIERSREPFKGLWSLPGGRVEAGETAEAAALRELREETGVAATSLGLATHLDVIGRDASENVIHHFVLLVFAACYADGTPVAGDGVRSVRWVAPSALGALRTTPNLGQAIAATAQHLDRASRRG